MKRRPTTVSCAVFMGRSPKTGKLVGSRHRWNGGYRCEFCHCTRDEVNSETFRGRFGDAPKQNQDATK